MGVNVPFRWLNTLGDCRKGGVNVHLPVEHSRRLAQRGVNVFLLVEHSRRFTPPSLDREGVALNFRQKILEIRVR